MADFDAHRILDASANRATEGLRVVEDYVRFVLNDEHLSRQLKQTRHDLAAACAAMLGTDRYASRDTQGDVGTAITTQSEGERVDAWSVCVASLERAKQSLRSLEEFGKVSSSEFAAQFESLRYQLYTLEKALAITADSRARLHDTHLCVLLDGQSSPEEFSERVQQLITAGVGMIQLRDKNLAACELVERARTLKRLAGDTLTIVNDRADIAAAAGADGVHLGQDDLDVSTARTILGPRKLIGVSTHSIEQARQAVLDGANYLGAGPTFPSTTKSFDEFPGLDYLREVTAEITLPTFAIGGINADNLSQVLDTGVTRVAVSSAASSAGELLARLRKQQKTEPRP